MSGAREEDWTFRKDCATVMFPRRKSRMSEIPDCRNKYDLEEEDREILWVKVDGEVCGIETPTLEKNAVEQNNGENGI